MPHTNVIVNEKYIKMTKPLSHCFKYGYVLHWRALFSPRRECDAFQEKKNFHTNIFPFRSLFTAKKRVKSMISLLILNTLVIYLINVDDKLSSAFMRRKWI